MDDFSSLVLAGAMAALVVAFIAGYIWGAYSERRDWNLLIVEGRLPHPVVEPARFRGAGFRLDNR
jgi:hypothetical protein